MPTELTQVNFAETALAHGPSMADSLAIVSLGQHRLVECHTWCQLQRQVAECRLGLIRHGVGSGDRIVAAVPNGTPAVVLHLAAAALGAHWLALPVTSDLDEVVASTDRRTRLVVLADGYLADGRQHSTTDRMCSLPAALGKHRPKLVLLPHLDPDSYVCGFSDWGSLFSVRGDLEFAPTAAEDLLWTSAASPSLAQTHWEAMHTNSLILADESGLCAGDVATCDATVADPDWPLLVSGLCLDATLLLIDPTVRSPLPELVVAGLDELADARVIVL